MMKLFLIVLLSLTACGGEFVPPQPDQGLDQELLPDNGSWKVEYFPDLGMCRAFRWQHEVVSANCEHNNGCHCSIGLGEDTVIHTCLPLNGFKPTHDACMESILACCFGDV